MIVIVCEELDLMSIRAKAGPHTPAPEMRMLRGCSWGGATSWVGIVMAGVQVVVSKDRSIGGTKWPSM